MEPTTTYRADIDGLRAIAVIAVVLYHFNVWPLSGGFVGVDIFFVISGYLITGIISREMRAGTFTFRGFYVRRARRILPALIATIIAALLVGRLVMMPGDYLPLGWQALSAVLGLSNFWFWQNTDYFDLASEYLPLLHTWSLAVEEQFYVLWPLLLLAVFAWREGSVLAIRITLLALIAVSLSWSVLAVQDGGRFAFYMLPTRAWELALGALLVFVPPLSNQRFAEIARWGGLTLIVASVVFFDHATPFPGLAALVPCIGAALIVFPVTRPTMAAQFLETRPMVFIGLISYSLYLWHWPVVSFFRYTAFEVHLTPVVTTGLLAISLILAVLSWRFIEQPFRRRREWNLSNKVLIAATLAAVLLIPGHVLLTNGDPGRLSPDVRALARGSQDRSPLRKDCHSKPVSHACTLGPEGVAPTVALIADSHGVEIGLALSEWLANQGQSLLMLTQSSCPAVMEYSPPERPDCSARASENLAYVTANREIATVFLAAYFAHYYEASGTSFETAFRAAVEQLLRSGKHVVIFEPFPFSKTSLIPASAARNEMRRPGTHLSLNLESYRESNATPLALLAELNGLPGVTVLPSSDALCENGLCPISEDNNVLWFDRHHLSMFGASRVVARLAPQLAQIPTITIQQEVSSNNPGAGRDSTRVSPAE